MESCAPILRELLQERPLSPKKSQDGWDYIGITEKQMETTIVYWGYTGIMEKQMETTI